jgi:hypothetical protein
MISDEEDKAKSSPESEKEITKDIFCSLGKSSLKDVVAYSMK